MQRKQVIVGAVVVAAIAVVIALGWSSGAERRLDEVARTDAIEPASRAQGERGAAGVASAPEPQELGRPVLPGDAGVAGARAHHAHGAPREEPAPVAGGGRRMLHPSMIEAGHSAGWRLGYTRGRIAVIEPRIARLREVLADLEARGDATAVERQRAILQRFENRLASLRQEETELEAEARRDGTLGEVEEGMQAVDLSQGERAPLRRAP